MTCIYNVLSVLKEAVPFGSLVVASIVAFLALKEYRLKVKAETRLAERSRVESDVKLIKIFTEIMDNANARSGYHVSEKAIEAILSAETTRLADLSPKACSDLLARAVVTLPVGAATQQAAFAAIGVLGKEHKILERIAIQALESLRDVNRDLADRYLNDFKTR
jgi:hypothetical protein